MKIENIERVNYIKNDLATFKRNIAQMKNWIDTHPDGKGFLLQEFSDGSGNLKIGLMFKEGNYNAVIYKELANAALEIFEKHYAVLLAEIEDL